MLSRWKLSILVAVSLLLYLWSASPADTYDCQTYGQTPIAHPPSTSTHNKFQWSNVPQMFPVAVTRTVPTSIPGSIPRIQHHFGKETAAEKKVRLARLELVKGNFTHAWNAYKEHTWLRDEVMPLSGSAHDPFGG